MEGKFGSSLGDARKRLDRAMWRSLAKGPAVPPVGIQDIEAPKTLILSIFSDKENKGRAYVSLRLESREDSTGEMNSEASSAQQRI